MLPELEVYDHGLSPLPMQNPYSKLILVIKSLFVNRLSKFLLHVTTNLVLNIVRKIFCLSPNKLYIIPENSLSKVKSSILYSFLSEKKLLLYS